MERYRDAPPTPGNALPHEVREAAGHHQPFIISFLVKSDDSHSRIMLVSSGQAARCTAGEHQVADLGLSLQHEG